eukprot:1402134-Prymnesium_polylepis.1
MYLRKRVPEFLMETRWTFPYDLEFYSIEAYSFDLAARARWNQATRSEWPSLVMSKIDRATARLPTLRKLLHSIIGHPAAIIRELHVVGDAMLGGDTAQKLPLLKLDDIERRLNDEYDALIQGRYDAGDATGEITRRLIKMLVPPKEEEKQDDKSAEGPTYGLLAPKRAAVRKATADRSFVELESRWMSRLQSGEMTGEDTLELLDACFQSGSVLPIAVLIATPGISLNAYYTESDFLNLLKDKRDNMRHYMGQGLAYDNEEDEVPEGLHTFAWNERQFDLFCQLEWGKLDPVNHIMLALKSKETTAKYAKHLLAGIYRDAAKVNDVREMLGKLFQHVGFPPTVPTVQGVSYDGFMKLILKLVKSTIGMDDESSRTTFEEVEAYMEEGFRAAAKRFAVKVYGAQLAGVSLGPWVEADSPVLVDLRESVQAVKDINRLVRRLPGRFGGGKTVSGLAGYDTVATTNAGNSGAAMHTTSSGLASDDGATPNKAGQRKAEKRAVEAAKTTRVGPEPLATSTYKGMTKEVRLNLNPKNVFYYDDLSFSMGKGLYDWPKIATKLGLDPKQLCGPVQCSMNKAKSADFNCMDADHK